MKPLALILLTLLLCAATALAARCEGKTPCKVCTNCKRCAWCNPHRAPKDWRPKPDCGKCRPIHIVTR